jgi:hypothetical protein
MSLIEDLKTELNYLIEADDLLVQLWQTSHEKIKEHYPKLYDKLDAFCEASYYNNCNCISDILSELEELQKAKDLLEETWIYAIGGYDEKHILKDDPDLHRKINNFMKFDDSE